jgi:hypothetical protein
LRGRHLCCPFDERVGRESGKARQFLRRRAFSRENDDLEADDRVAFLLDHPDLKPVGERSVVDLRKLEWREGFRNRGSLSESFLRKKRRIH